MFAIFLNPLAVILSLATTTGILVHDTHINSALALPSALATTDDGNRIMMLLGTTHTHAERDSLSQAVHDLKAQTPSVQPRLHEDKKHLLQKYASRGHHAFDNYNLPIV